LGSYVAKGKIVKAKQAMMNKANMYGWTEQAKVWCKNLFDLTYDVANDNRQEDREKKQECKACFYSSRFGGSAMVTQPCMCCGKDVMYSSTNTDRLCMYCAKKHQLCKHCGGDISMRARRKDWPEKDAE
jgi:hypothetical protein